MATMRVTTDALAFMLDLPQEIEIKDIEVVEQDDESSVLMLHIEGTHPVNGEPLEDVEYRFNYELDDHDQPNLVGIEPIDSD